MRKVPYNFCKLFVLCDSAVFFSVILLRVRFIVLWYTLKFGSHKALIRIRGDHPVISQDQFDSR